MVGIVCGESEAGKPKLRELARSEGENRVAADGHNSSSLGPKTGDEVQKGNDLGFYPIDAG